MDKLAAAAYDTAANASIPISTLHLKHFLKPKFRRYWQSTWDKHTDNKLHVIKPEQGNWPPLSKPQDTEVKLAMLKTAHTHRRTATHAELLSGGDQQLGERFGEPLTVLHILINCSELDALRKTCFLLSYR